MAAAASKPPDSKPLAVPEEDETEMTSIMDADQRRELQRAARAEAARMQEPTGEAPKAADLERPTARPPAEAEALAAEELAIPKSARVPSEAHATPLPSPAPASSAKPSTSPEPTEEAPEAHPHDPAATPPWVLVAFALLIAAVAFVLRS
ncbi:MAG TPA: hypothetical protein VGG39_11515 [Polyangiaceae bacterium]|jgi:hypothetical protein